MRSSFDSERAMHAPLMAMAEGHVRSQSGLWVLSAEQPAGTRIPDLICARINPVVLQERFDGGLTRPLTRAEVRTLFAMTRQRWSKPERLAAHLGVSARQVRRVLARLIADGFAESHSSTGAVRRHAALKRLTSRILSFEAKIADWRSGLVQARSHKRFANASYVVFDTSFERRFLSARHFFRSAGVGLIALSADDHTHTRHIASRNRPWDAQSVVMVEELLLASLMGASRAPLPETRLPNAEVLTVGQEPPKIAGSLPRGIRRSLAAAASV